MVVFVVLTGLRYLVPGSGSSIDLFGGFALLAGGVGFVVRGMWGTGLFMVAAGLWGLLVGTANAAQTNCPNALGNVTGWTVDQQGSSSHRVTNLGASIRRGIAAPAYDEMTLTKDLPAGCTVTVTVEYDLALLPPMAGVPQAAVAFANWSADQTGVEGSQSGSFTTTLTGPTEMRLTTWLSGTTGGHAVATLETVLHRLSPEKKAEGRQAAHLLEDIGTGLAVSAPFIPDKKVAIAMGLSAGASKAFSKWLLDAIDNDPPDPLYRQVYYPAAVPMPPGVPAWLQPLLALQLKEREFARALYVSVNRANTAATKGDAVAEDKQQAAVDRYTQRLGVFLAREADLRAAAAPRLRTYGVEVAEPSTLATLRTAARELAR